MPKKWTREEEEKRRGELADLYVAQNKSIRQTAAILGVKEQTVFARLVRLGIKTEPRRKEHYLNKRTDIRVPSKYSKDLAEFFGIMLGDGHVSHFQVLVHLGTKEAEYAEYVRALISKLFHASAKTTIRKTGYRDVYLGSTLATSWLLEEGLVGNKVKSQVGVPRWILSSKSFARGFVRGFFDTDGSVYRIRYGTQISFTNYSLPLLHGLQKTLSILGYTPSEVSSYKIYLTRADEIKRFFKDIDPMNPKHRRRFENLMHAPVG